MCPIFNLIIENVCTVSQKKEKKGYNNDLITWLENLTSSKWASILILVLEYKWWHNLESLHQATNYRALCLQKCDGKIVSYFLH